MKKLLFTLFAFSLSLSSQAQNIDSVRVSPVSPNTGTPVTVYVYGYFSSLSMPLSVTHTVTGNIIQVNVERCKGQAMAIDYTTDSVNVGLLAAGTYTVNAFMHTSIYDMNTGTCPASTITDNESYTFTVTSSTSIHAGTSLSAAHVSYNSNEGTLHVSVPESMRACKVSVVDLSGRTLETRTLQQSRKSTQMRLDVPPGLYLVKFEDGTSTTVFKIAIP